MQATPENYREALERVCSETIAPAAAEVDRTGQFPKASIDALKDSGLLGALTHAAMTAKQ